MKAGDGFCEEPGLRLQGDVPAPSVRLRLGLHF
jgi:hypothetical protein